MTKEQIIVGLNKMLDNTIKVNECGLSNNDFKDDIELLKTVLSMLKENSAEIEQKNTELAEIEKKDKIIDLMARTISNNIVITHFNDTENVKKYYEKLVERK